MGSSNIASVADVTIAMEFLDQKYKHQTLPYPYNHYATLEITTRHGEWPQRFAVERREDSLLFHKSDVWSDIGKKVMPDEIKNILMMNDGEMLQKELIEAMEERASYATIHKAINELKNNKQIEKITVNLKGKRMIKLRLL